MGKPRISCTALVWAAVLVGRLQPLSLASQNLVAFRDGGAAAFAIRDYDTAQASFASALKLAPASGAERVNLGATLEARGELAAALEQYQAAVRLEPDNYEPRAYAGFVLFKQGAYDASIASLKESMLLQPAQGSARYTLAFALERTGAMEEAVAQFEQGIKVSESDLAISDGEYNLGKLRIRQMKISQAELCFRRAVTLRPAFVNGLFDIGWALGEQAFQNSTATMEQHDASAYAWLKVLSVDPAHIQTHYALARHHYNFGVSAFSTASPDGGDVVPSSAGNPALEHFRLAQDPSGLALSKRGSCVGGAVQVVYDWETQPDVTVIPIVPTDQREGAVHVYGSVQTGPYTLQGTGLVLTPNGGTQDWEHMRYFERRSFLVKMKDVMVGPSGVVVSSDACKVFLASQGAWVPLWRLQPPSEGSVRRFGTVFSVLQMSGGNYYHWTCEILTRLVLLQGTFRKTPGAWLLVPGFQWSLKFILQSLQAFGLLRNDVPHGDISHNDLLSSRIVLQDDRWAPDTPGAAQSPPKPWVAADALYLADWRSYEHDDRPGREFHPPRMGLQLVRWTSWLSIGLLPGMRPVEYHSSNVSIEITIPPALPMVSLAAPKNYVQLQKLPRLSLNVVYVSRNREHSNRALLNEAGVIELLTVLVQDYNANCTTTERQNASAAAAGLPRLQLWIFKGESTSMADTVAMFAKAAIVVGVHGAGLSNVAFCKPGAALLEVSMPSPHLRMYMHVAAALDLRYWVLPAVSSVVGLAFNNKVSVPLDRLQATFRDVVRQLKGELEL
jgi:tetratricopeptide (TPR) repeat protein